MIKISHQQAEWLIRRQFDMSLSDEEWNALQCHLEYCPTCRIYQIRLQHTERKISQCLRDRWEPVSGPSRGLPQIVWNIHSERDKNRIKLVTSAVYLAVFSLILLLAAVQVQSKGIQKAIPQTGGDRECPTSIPSPTQIYTAIPLIQPGIFPHIIAYESQSDGNAEIYLLNPGFSPVNLTQHPAEDTFPTWSPDGEWLAFLSNRDNSNKGNGKNELYVITIAGTRLVQLTSETLVDWIGPLSWSSDGNWIALVGVLQNEPRQRSIYVVGVDGSGSRRLLNTQGGDSPKFAPYGDRLAFRQTEGSLNRIVIYHVDSGRVTFENIPQSSHNQSATDVSFDWPADGDGLYYTASLSSVQKCSRLVIQQAPNDETWHEKLLDHFHFVGRKVTGAIHSISWAPKELVIYSVDYPDQDSMITHCNSEEDCSGFLDSNPSRLSSSNNSSFYPGLCIQSVLDRGSWSLDMHWLIFTAFEQDSNFMGLYAVRMPGLSLSWQLSGADGVQGAAIPDGSVFRLSPSIIQSSLTRMRPFRTPMKIDPSSVR